MNTNSSLIYNTSTELYLVFEEGKFEEYETERLVKAFEEVGVKAQVSAANETKKSHEIVLGKNDREVSKKAYSELEKIEKYPTDGGRFLIYSDGASVALAYDEEFGNFSRAIAINYFVENYIKEELILDAGIVHSESFDLPTRLGEMDKKYMDSQWKHMEDTLGEGGGDVVDAFKSFYELYDGEKIISWLAKLYEPNICVCKKFRGESECKHTEFCGTGGFYYSNSARDNIGFLPDAESCAQAMSIIGYSGLNHGLGGPGYVPVIPKDVAEKIWKFAYSLQQDDGFFYHPQWGRNIVLSRRGRDHTWCTRILDDYHIPKKYSQVASQTSAPASAPKQEFAVAPHLETLDAFKAYLKELDIANKSYPAGNTLSAQSTQIYARGQEYINAMVDELTRIYNEYGNGTFHHTVDYYAINGVMKIVGQFTGAGRELPDIERTARACFAAISSDEPVETIVDIWNPWVGFNRCINNIEKCGENGKERALALKKELYADYAKAIRVTKDKLALFRKPDGSFSYFKDRSSHHSQAALVSLPNQNEGDVNATVLGTNNFTYELFTLVNPMGLGRLPFALTKERYLFYKILGEFDKK